VSVRRVAVTGLGIVSALGNDLATCRQALAAGRSAIAPLQSVATAKLRFRNGAEVHDFDPEKHFPGGKADFLDRFAQFAVVAARQALAASGLVITPASAPRTAVILGACVGGQSTEDAGFVDLYQQDRGRVHPLTIPKTMANAGASHICMEFGVTGPALTISTACSSANHAIGQAFWMVRSGQSDLAITGGSEAPFSFGILKAWEAMRVVSPDTCRPFSQDRSGMILGEGGAILILEPLDAARARGARIYGEVVGFGMSADAHHITQPSVAGPALAMRNALADAALDPTQVGHINAHGTATPANDPIESKAIREVFGAHAPNVLVTSTKSMHGHALGAAGAIEAVATLLALADQCVPPTANFTTLDPECDIHVVANQATAASFECALSNSFAFGGLNAVLAFRRASS
jgi:nodulation protein E